MFKQSGINPACYVLERQYQKKCVIRSKLFSERLANARSLYKKDLFAHYGCVNAIEFSNDGELLISGGDDRRVLLWSMVNAIHGEGLPISMRTNHLSNIFCLGFDSKNSRIFSGGNDDQLLVHDIQTRLLVDKLIHKKPIYGLHVNPQNDDIVATAGDDGRILIYDLRETSEGSGLCLAKQKTGFHSVMYNPSNTALLTTANADEGIALWDSRKPKERLIHYDSQAGSVSGISACFNSSGSQILALRRRLPPVLYNSQQEENICQFYHPHYYNSCTMKTCCFAGENDEYILSGSDDFNLYMWAIPKDNSEWGSTHLVLSGHRSIVNQVRYNKQNNVIASSGVEKMIKFWSTLPIGDWIGSLSKDISQPERSVYSHEEYIRLVGIAGERISHDYSEHSILEDSRMMAFFDSLIQREIEGWESMNNSNNSDSGSDTSSKSYNELSKVMYVNRENLEEEPKTPKQNKIAQLIEKKRNVLVKMAHDKSLKYRRNGSAKESNKKIRSCKYKNIKKSKTFAAKKSPRKECTNEKRTTKKDTSPVRGKLKKFRTRESLRDICDNFNTSIDTPSTSTGITSSQNNLFRVIEQDSEEEIPTNGCIESSTVQEENLVNILPTPINGTQDTFVHTLTTYSSDISEPIREDSLGSPSTSRQNRYRYDSAVCIDGGLERASSSNDATSSFPRSSFNGSYPPVDMNPNSDSDCDIDYVTPVKKRCTVSDLDSGFATGPSSSMNSYEKNSSSHQGCSDDTSCSSDDELKYERFRKQTRRSRVNNIRKKLTDSDSN